MAEDEIGLLRLDHVIFEVPDISVSHTWMTESLGYPEAWPVGRFWPQGRTSGVAIGGLNLEFLQPDNDAPSHPVGRMLVFEPSSLQEAAMVLTSAGISADERRKTESDPTLLRLRGYRGSSARTTQHICTNLVPKVGSRLPFDFFVCDYAREMKERLSPLNPRLSAPANVRGIRYATPHAEEATMLLARLGYRGDLSIEFVEGCDHQILEVLTDRGPLHIR